MEMNIVKVGSWCGAMISIALVIGGILTGYSEIQGMNLRTAEAMAVASANKVAIEEEQKTNAQNTAILTQLAAQVANIYKRGLVVQGKALVLNVGDEPYVELNSRDPNGPTRLAGFDHLHVTNLTHPDMIMADMDIGPSSFSNATAGYVMNLSKAAGALLHAAPGTWIEVRAVPHFDEVEVAK